MRTDRVKEYFGERSDIDVRTFAFAGGVIKLVRDAGPRLPHAIGDRAVMMAAEIGELAIEAQIGNNKDRFLKKMTAARRLSRQIAYWLKLIDEAEAVPRERIIALLDQARDVNKALTALSTEARTEKNGK